MEKPLIKTFSFIRILLIVFLLFFGLVGCKSNTSSGGGEFKDPYEAYGLQKGEDGLSNALHDNPPKAIVFKPLYLYTFGVAEVLDIEEISLAKGEKDSISVDFEKVLSEDNIRKQIGYLTAQVGVTFNTTKDGYLFQVYNEIDAKKVYKHVGIEDRVREEKHAKSETIYQIARWGLPDIPDDEYLTFILGEKGKAGNSGMVLCQILSVKR